MAEHGYGLGRTWWGRGLMTEACRALLRHGFEDLDLEVIYARVDPANRPSVRVVEKLGFTYEGTLRQRTLARGVRVDHQHWGLLRSEWEA